MDARANGLPARKVAETVVKALAAMAASAEWKPIVEGTGLLYTKVDGGMSLVKDQQAREALRASVAGEIMRIDEAIAKVRAAQIKILARGDASFPAKAAVESLLREAKCNG